MSSLFLSELQLTVPPIKTAVNVSSIHLLRIISPSTFAVPVQSLEIPAIRQIESVHRQFDHTPPPQTRLMEQPGDPDTSPFQCMADSWTVPSSGRVSTCRSSTTTQILCQIDECSITPIKIEGIRPIYLKTMYYFLSRATFMILNAATAGGTDGTYIRNILYEFGTLKKGH